MSFIKNFGLYWARDGVDFGSQGRAGSLCGYKANSDEAVDFREQVGVYILYEGIDISTLKVIYVGQVARKQGDSLLARLREHCRDHLQNRWKRFSWFGMYEVGKNNNLIRTNIEKALHSPLTGVIDHLEGALITLLEPDLNKQGANWNGAKQYFQKEEGLADIFEQFQDLKEQLETISRKLPDQGKL